MSMGFETAVGALLSINLRATLLLLFVLVALSTLRAASGAAKHGIWLTAIVGCLVLPLMSAILPTLSLPLLPAEAPVPESVPSIVPDGGLLETAAAPEKAARISPALFLLALYGLGVMSVIAHFAVAVCRVARLGRQMSEWPDPAANEVKNALCSDLQIERPVALLRHDCAASPFTWGTRRPRVVLPAAAQSWSSERLRNVLLHELCHVRRYDWLRLCLERMAAAVYWFNPLIWIATRQSRFEAERACDDFVLRSGGRSSEYAEQLVDLMHSNRVARGAGIALGHGDFGKRIRSILNPREEAPVMTRLKSGVLSAATALIVLVLAACQVTSGQPVGSQAAGTAAAQVRPDAEAARQEREQALIVVQQEAEQAERELVRRRENAELEAELENLQQRLMELTAEQKELASERQRLESRGVGDDAARAAVQRLAQRMEAVERMRQQTLRGQAEILARAAEMNARAAASAATEASGRQERLATLAVELEARSVALLESRDVLAQQEQRIRDLQASLDQRTAELRQTERQLVELQAQLDQALTE